MQVNSVKTSLGAPKKDNSLGENSKKNQQKNPSFKGLNPIVTIMEAIDRGGFAASFIAQDGLGMVAPRIKEGLNRNRKEDENGKKTGPLNWEFARREGVREILSGPSAFIIPAGILMAIKKYSGTANNVHIDHIKAFGDEFGKYASESSIVEIPQKPSRFPKINKFFKKFVPARFKTIPTVSVENIEKFKDIKNADNIKSEFYERIMRNVLDTTTENKLPQHELEALTKDVTKRIIEIENAPSKGAFRNFFGIKVENSAQDLMGELVGDLMKLKKQHLSPSSNELLAHMTLENGNKLDTSFPRLISSLKDYADDAIGTVNTKITKETAIDVPKFMKEFNFRRIGTRTMSNLGMFLAVVGFYTIIPKLYNLGIKHDPGLVGLEDATQNAGAVVETIAENKNAKTEQINNKTAETQEEKTAVENIDDETEKSDKKDVPFTGGFHEVAAKTGETVMKSNWLQKLVKNFEFNGPSMSVLGMLTLLFGFCLPPRIKNAKSDKERAEIIVRDISSFTAILFGAKALSRGMSDGFAKLSGLALNTKPKGHNDSILKKAFNYITPTTGVDVLSSSQIVSKYSNIQDYPGGIKGFFDFLENNGGNLNKALGLDKEVKANANTIIGNYFAGKSLKDVTSEQIRQAFDAARNSDELKSIYKIFEKADNKFIGRAKLFNSSFGFISTLLLVPAFMIWLARYCEKMTKRKVDAEKEAKQQQGNSPADTVAVAETKATETEAATSKVTVSQAKMIHTNKPTMEGFLKK